MPQPATIAVEDVRAFLDGLRSRAAAGASPAAIVDDIGGFLASIDPLSPLDRRDEMIVSLAERFYSDAAAIAPVADALANGLLFPSTARWGDTSGERLVQMRDALADVHAFCVATDTPIPGYSHLRNNVLRGARTPIKGPKTRPFRAANSLLMKLAAPAAHIVSEESTTVDRF